MSAAAEITPREVVEEYFRRLDADDLEGASEVFAEDVSVRFGDQPPVIGREQVRDRLAGFGPMIESWVHEPVHVHVVPGPPGNTTVIFESFVTYNMRHSGNVIAHQSVCVSVVGPSGEIIEQRNVGDLRPVLDDHRSHAPA
jgi:hypothetical protein